MLPPIFQNVDTTRVGTGTSTSTGPAPTSCNHPKCCCDHWRRDEAPAPLNLAMVAPKSRAVWKRSYKRNNNSGDLRGRRRIWEHGVSSGGFGHELLVGEWRVLAKWTARNPLSGRWLLVGETTRAHQSILRYMIRPRSAAAALGSTDRVGAVEVGWSLPYKILYSCEVPLSSSRLACKA
jgi:hypothetical protein